MILPTNIRRTVGPQFDVSPDGKRFLINTLTHQEEAAPITLVHNWEAALKK